MAEVFQKGATSKTVYVIIRDPATMQGLTGLTNATAGLKFYYTRDLAAATAITLAAQTPTGAYTSGGFCAVDGTNQPGLYRLDLPNAALATGVNTLRVTWSAGGTLTDGVDIALTDYDPTAVDKAGFSLSAAGNTAVRDTILSDGTAFAGANVALIKAKTDNLPAAPAAVADIPTAAANATALLDGASAVETGLTVRGALRLIMAVLAGKATVSGGTVTFNAAVTDAKARVTATAAGGVRTAVTTDQT